MYSLILILAYNNIIMMHAYVYLHSIVHMHRSTEPSNCLYGLAHFASEPKNYYNNIIILYYTKPTVSMGASFFTVSCICTGIVFENNTMSYFKDPLSHSGMYYRRGGDPTSAICSKHVQRALDQPCMWSPLGTAIQTLNALHV